MLLPTLLGLTACLLIGTIVSRNRWAARIFGVALAIPLALLTYGVIGVAIARVIGVGRFYSVPFGAEYIKDWHILASLATWISIWVLILWRLGRPHSRIPPGTPSAKLLHSVGNMLEQPAAIPRPPDPIDKPPPDIKPVPPPDIPPPAGDPDVQPPPGPPERGINSPVI